MQAPSPAAEPPIDFEAALTRLAGGMPRPLHRCLSAGERKQGDLPAPATLSCPHSLLVKEHQADRHTVRMLTVYACRGAGTRPPKPALQPAPSQQTPPFQEASRPLPSLMPMRRLYDKAPESLFIGRCDPFGVPQIRCLLFAGVRRYHASPEP